MARTFEDAPARRAQVPVLLGLYGPSSSGKTFSALRLATGMVQASGGEIYVVDTEARRALHYADAFRFRHVPFGEPFSPHDYLAAIQHCVERGAAVVIVDSMSHEHEGPGGVLEMHDQEVERLAKAWNTSRDKVKMSAWQAPKAQRRDLVSAILRSEASFIFCFRAKEKLKVVPGKNPEQLGWQPIGAPELAYEMTVNALLLPGAGGVPTWRPDEPAEKLMVKLPAFARPWFTDGRPLDEATGRELARWASGTRSVAELIDAYAAADAELFEDLERERRELWRRSGATEKDAMKSAAATARARLGLAAEEGS